MAEPRRLNVDLLRVPDALLTIDDTDYLIRGSALFGDHLLKLVEIEHRLLRAEQEDELALAKEASDVILDLVRLETPDAPLDAEGKPTGGSFDLNPVQALAIFAHIVGADSVTSALTDALQAGLQGLDEDALVALLQEAEEDDTGPLAKEKRSSGGSSGSGNKTDGRRSGGRKRAGARAGSTSRSKPKGS